MGARGGGPREEEEPRDYVAKMAGLYMKEKLGSPVPGGWGWGGEGSGRAGRRAGKNHRC